MTKEDHAVAMVYGDIIALKWASDDPMAPTVAAFYGTEEEEADDVQE